MTQGMTGTRSYKAPLGRRLAREARVNWQVHLMWLPVLAYFIIFQYVPMGGLIIAFQDYKAFRGIAGSAFVGLKHFRNFLTGMYASRTIGNTITINVLQILWGFPMPILLALLTNEVRRPLFKRTVQTVNYMPHFISLVVMCGILKEFSASDGLFNAVGGLLGGEKLNYLTSAKYYRTIYVGSGIWKQMGWGSIIYLSALSAIDPSLYESAAMDGAGRFRQMLHITLPALVPIITIQLIMRLGNIMSEGHQKTILLYNEMTWEVSDIISSYVYRKGLLDNELSFGAAVGLFNSVVNVTILCASNWFARTFVKESLW